MRSSRSGRLAALVCLLSALAVACATEQSRHAPLGSPAPARPVDADVEVFRSGSPARPFVEQARLDVHVEKVALLGTSFDQAVESLKHEARLAGCDAIVDVRERRSRVGETRIYHVTATGVRYTDRDPDAE